MYKVFFPLTSYEVKILIFLFISRCPARDTCWTNARQWHESSGLRPKPQTSNPMNLMVCGRCGYSGMHWSATLNKKQHTHQRYCQRLHPFHPRLLFHRAEPYLFPMAQSTLHRASLLQLPTVRQEIMFRPVGHDAVLDRGWARINIRLGWRGGDGGRKRKRNRRASGSPCRKAVANGVQTKTVPECGKLWFLRHEIDPCPSK